MKSIGVMIRLLDCFNNQWKSGGATQDGWGLHWAVKSMSSDRATIVMSGAGDIPCPGSQENHTVKLGEFIYFGNKNIVVELKAIYQSSHTVYIKVYYDFPWASFPFPDAEPVPPVDPCEGVVCAPKCVGVDLYRQNCANGVCGPDLLLEKNAASCGYVAPVENPTGQIGSIRHTIHEEIGEDEVIFTIPITNNSSKTTYNYIELYDASGKKIDKEPDIRYVSIGAGKTVNISLSSRWKTSWSIEDVQGQIVTFKLLSSFSWLLGHQKVDTKSYSVAAYEEKPPVEPPVEEQPTGEIWPVSHQIHEEIGKDEITFKIPVTNTSDKTTVNYVKLYDATGKEIERQPYFDHTYESIGAGSTFDFKLSSKWRLWSIEDVQGQTVTFKLFSAFSTSMLDVKQLVDTLTYFVEAYDEKPPVDPCEGVVCEPVCVGVDLYRQSCVDGKCGPDLLFEEKAAACGYVAPYEPPVEPPIEPPVEPPTDEEDDVLMYIALFAIAYIMFSNG